MTNEEKEQLKAAIEKKIAENLQAIKDLRELTKPMGLDSAVGRLSRMDYINNKAINEAELQKAKAKLKIPKITHTFQFKIIAPSQ